MGRDPSEIAALIDLLESMNAATADQAADVARDMFHAQVRNLTPTNPAEAFEAATTVAQYQAQMDNPLWIVTDKDGNQN